VLFKGSRAGALSPNREEKTRINREYYLSCSLIKDGFKRFRN